MPNKPKLSKSGVSWTDYGWPVVDGCTKVSPACANCYGEGYAHRFWGDRPFSEVRTHPEKLEAPLNTKKPGKVFVAPLGDLFHLDVPFTFVEDVFKIIEQCPQHTFQILTKRPERMAQYFKWDMYENPLPNVWLGVTVENNDHLDRIDYLLQCPAAVYFISMEPLLEHVELKPEHLKKLHLVILGGESGPKARPMHPDDARFVRDQCVAAGVKFYFKQWGEWLPMNQRIDGRHYSGLKTTAIERNGTVASFFNTGTKRAGCLLDGREWKQFPEVGCTL